MCNMQLDLQEDIIYNDKGCKSSLGTRWWWVYLTTQRVDVPMTHCSRSFSALM